MVDLGCHQISLKAKFEASVIIPFEDEYLRLSEGNWKTEMTERSVSSWMLCALPRPKSHLFGGELYWAVLLPKEVQHANRTDTAERVATICHSKKKKKAFLDSLHFASLVPAVSGSGMELSVP